METRWQESLSGMLEEIDSKISRLQQLRELINEELGGSTDPSLLERLLPIPEKQSGEHEAKARAVREKQVVQYLRKHGPTPPGQLKKKLGVGWSTIYYLIKKADSLERTTDGLVALRGKAEKVDGSTL